MSIATSLIEQAQAFLSHRRNRHIVLFGIAALSLLLIFHTTNPSPLSQFSPKEAVKVLPHSGYRSTKERVERSHKLYAESIQRREALIKKLGPEPKDLEPFPGLAAKQERRMAILWDFLSPAWSCPHEMQRLGPAGDGGKWLCGYDRVSQVPDCVIYSFGVEQESAYEADLLRRSPSCQLYLFDGAKKQAGSQVLSDPALAARTTFKPYRLDSVDLAASSANPTTKTLQSIIQELGHSFVDILKIDVEGAEFDVLKELFRRAKSQPLPFGQLQLEIHAWDYSFGEWMGLWKEMEHAGLRPFTRELNYQDAHNGKSPRVIEYGFVNVRARHHLLEDTL